MNSRTTRNFRQILANLPSDVRRQARTPYRHFRNNPNHPGLRFKSVHRTEPMYSVRTSLDYRAVGVIDSGEIVWFWIGPHAEYERLLARL